jgi:hypothetical protein
VIRLLVAVSLIAAACTTVATVPSVASISLTNAAHPSDNDDLVHELGDAQERRLLWC